MDTWRDALNILWYLSRKRQKNIYQEQIYSNALQKVFPKKYNQTVIYIMLEDKTHHILCTLMMQINLLHETGNPYIWRVICTQIKISVFTIIKPYIPDFLFVTFSRCLKQHLDVFYTFTKEEIAYTGLNIWSILWNW